MGIRRQLTGLVAVLVIGLSAASAEAGPMINGSFTMMSLFTAVNDAGAEVSDLRDATKLEFHDFFGSESAGYGRLVVLAAEGDFAPLTTGFFNNSGTIKDLAFGNASLPIGGFESLLSGALTFDLEQIFVRDQGAGVLHLAGTGFFNWSSAGFDATRGSFDLYATGNGVSVGYSAAPVPEPASLLLLGSGAVAGISRLRRRYRTA